ncbi:unnamed protein product [Linum tenue]|uniref:DUF569 domain-containing protein n=1 Tax=Linum tenue TaxID=586396 RepID=A0AAV0JLG4_9ROSI|nr:unnamed protein product [Linum tenue]
MGDKAIPDRASTTTSPFPFFPNFHLDFPNPFRRETQQPRRQIVASDDPTPAAAADKPDAVKFAEQRKPSSTAPPLQLEVDEPSHPLLTYSVYALGGFIVLKWTGSFNQFRSAMEFFHKAKVVRLRSHHDKYLLADDNEESVLQD